MQIYDQVLNFYFEKVLFIKKTSLKLFIFYF